MAYVWPQSTWEETPPAMMGMDKDKLEQARDYALTGGGSGIITRGGKVVLQDLKQIKTEWSSPAEAFKDAYEHEQFITGKINDLTSVAREEKDYASEPMLAWFSDEQIEEEASVGKIADELAMVGEDKSGLLMIDRELAQRAYPPASPFDPSTGDEE